jgi:hypothetical protein
MATNVGGFSLTWLILGVAFFPLMVWLSWHFVRQSERLEADLVRLPGGAEANAGDEASE